MILNEIIKNEIVADVEKTKDYNKNIELCNCETCNNFYNQIYGRFPNLENFLSDFGIDIARPDEETLGIVLFNEDTVQYMPYYTVCGTLGEIKSIEFVIDGIDVKLFASCDPFYDIPNSQTGEYFVIKIGVFTLPNCMKDLSENENSKIKKSFLEFLKTKK